MFCQQCNAPMTDGQCAECGATRLLRQRSHDLDLLLRPQTQNTPPTLPLTEDTIRPSMLPPTEDTLRPAPPLPLTETAPADAAPIEKAPVGSPPPNAHRVTWILGDKVWKDTTMLPGEKVFAETPQEMKGRSVRWLGWEVNDFPMPNHDVVICGEWKKKFFTPKRLLIMEIVGAAVILLWLVILLVVSAVKKSDTVEKPTDTPTVTLAQAADTPTQGPTETLPEMTEALTTEAPAEIVTPVMSAAPTTAAPPATNEHASAEADAEGETAVTDDANAAKEPAATQTSDVPDQSVEDGSTPDPRTMNDGQGRNPFPQV